MWKTIIQLQVIDVWKNEESRFCRNKKRTQWTLSFNRRAEHMQRICFCVSRIPDRDTRNGAVAAVVRSTRSKQRLWLETASSDRVSPSWAKPGLCLVNSGCGLGRLVRLEFWGGEGCESQQCFLAYISLQDGSEGWRHEGRFLMTFWISGFHLQELRRVWSEEGTSCRHWKGGSVLVLAGSAVKAGCYLFFVKGWKFPQTGWDFHKNLYIFFLFFKPVYISNNYFSAHSDAVADLGI